MLAKVNKFRIWLIWPFALGIGLLSSDSAQKAAGAALSFQDIHTTFYLTVKVTDDDQEPPTKSQALTVTR